MLISDILNGSLWLGLRFEQKSSKANSKIAPKKRAIKTFCAWDGEMLVFNNWVL
ncbi:hypothetical protein [Methylotenera versatilis]|uniref:hypothetical protein n=1 Tax=Methylotenera versatilis TaxID=1055487 RepID=UPI000B0BBD71|nr:hypothetical protein [Methylotenera versatilis]